MRVVVTGAKGYIGTQVVNLLSQKSGLQLIPMDIEEWDIRQASKDIAPDIDVVVHLAALVKVGESVQRPTAYFYTNTVGTKNVINRFPNAKFIFASTGAAYDPTSPYALSKVAAEDIVKENCSDYTIFRFFNVGGRTPTNPEGLYAATQNAIESKKFTIFGNDYNTPDGTCIRDYIHVSDLAEAHISALNNLKNINGHLPLNVGLGKGITVLELIKIFEKVNKVKVPYKISRPRKGDIPISYSSNEKILKFLHWIPKKSYEQMCFDAWQGRRN